MQFSAFAAVLSSLTGGALAATLPVFGGSGGGGSDTWGPGDLGAAGGSGGPGSGGPLAGVLSALSALGGSAGSWGPGGVWGPPSGYNGSCVNLTSVERFVTGYTYLLEHPGGANFNATAEDILAASEFTVQSDSIRTLSGLPLGPPAYPSRDVYIATQFITPALPNVTTLDVFASCFKIAWRWNATGIGSNQYPVNGIITFDVDLLTDRIQTVYSEFNTAAFEADLGL